MLRYHRSFRQTPPRMVLFYLQRIRIAIPNEAHEIVVIPAAKHQTGEKVKCTYIEIPQAEETYRVSCYPSHSGFGELKWAQMSFGVTIGNEAIFSPGTVSKRARYDRYGFLAIGVGAVTIC